MEEIIAGATGCGAVTVTVIVVLWRVAPLPPVTVTVYVPAFTLSAMLIVRVDVPEPPNIDGLLSVAVGPDGETEVVSVTVPEKPPDGVTVMVAVPELPCWIDRLL